MFASLQQFATDLTQNFDQIPIERKAVLQKIAAFVQAGQDKQIAINLVYVCTHNSRRSHFGQVAASLAASFYGVQHVHTFSGGTEATAFNPNAIKALQSLGFEVVSDNKTDNPVYTVSFGEGLSTTCFSKVYDHPSNPNQDFAAIMTCTDAEQNCPFIAGATLRIATPYLDPKASDGQPDQDATYLARFTQIATETFYVFGLVV